MNNLLVILGPTASGKTKLAVKLARKFNGEIISADSRQLYRGLNIGTGKDLSTYRINNIKKTKILNLKSKIPYHLINIAAPNRQFTLAEYQQLAIKKINQILKRGRLPIFVGGTGLYLSAVIDNYRIPAIAPNPSLRKKIESLTTAQKITQLKKLDPDAFKFLDEKNPRRLNRALEVCLAGYRFSALRQKNPPLFNALLLGIKPSSSVLTKKINERVDIMLRAGLIAETKKLLKKYGSNTQLLHTLGYAEIIDYLNKKTTLAAAVKLIKIHTRQYARRQLIWFHKMSQVRWTSTYKEAERLINKFLTR